MRPSRYLQVVGTINKFVNCMVHYNFINYFSFIAKHNSCWGTDFIYSHLKSTFHAWSYFIVCLISYYNLLTSDFSKNWINWTEKLKKNKITLCLTETIILLCVWWPKSQEHHTGLQRSSNRGRRIKYHVMRTG
jgi:hypothetical protein